MLQHGDLSESVPYYVGANVEVSHDAVVASGAVLEAAHDSQLVIEPGVCIGAGAVIQAFGGKLTLATGANVGQGVLLLGAGNVGTGACIGAESTLINPRVEANQVIPSRSLLGDLSRTLTPKVSSEVNGSLPNGKVAEVKEATASPEDVTEADSNGSSLVTSGTVYGRDQVMRLVQTLFPHRNAVMSESEES